MRRGQALQSTRKQRIKKEISEQSPVDVFVSIIYRLERLEERLEDYNSGDFDKVLNRTHDMGRIIGDLAERIDNLRQQGDSGESSAGS